ncbi:MAG: hypothetical protein U0457_00885 [Candidatus Sericytochromatia bacterium]
MKTNILNNKKLKYIVITIVVMFTFLFDNYSPAFANITNNNKVVNIISLENKSTDIFNFNLEENNLPFQIAEAKKSKSYNPMTFFWFLSIALPGFGQILMGDLGRGLSFWLWIIVGSLLLAITIVGIVLIPVYIIIIYIWNIIDSYYMSRDLSRDAYINKDFFAKLDNSINLKIKLIEF